MAGKLHSSLGWSVVEVGKEASLKAEDGTSGRYRNFSLMVLFALTMLLSATLLFVVQPMFARMILPLLGGSQQVWTTAMLFYQLVLLGGYLYAHVGTARLPVRSQVALHAIVLLLPLLALPIRVPPGWVPPPEANPTPWVLALLVVAVGLPLFVVSTTSPVLQRWFGHTGHPAAPDPYFLYAASNLGSMVGLLSYPFLIEPALRLGEQSGLWSIGYGMLVVCTSACAIITWRSAAPAPSADRQTPALFAGGHSEITTQRRLRWVMWAFIPSSVMLSVTTYLTTDVAAVPLLWIVPLALYLLTFVLAFARKRLFRYEGMVRALRLLLVVVVYTFLLDVTDVLLAPLHLVTFFVLAMASHSALAKDRPSAEHLTEFYLWIAVGGALGGVLNGLVAPALFTSVTEYPLVLALAALSHVRKEDISCEHRVRRLDFGLPVALGFVVLGVDFALRAAGLEAHIGLRCLVLVLPMVAAFRLSQRPIRFGLGITALMLATLVPGPVRYVRSTGVVVSAQRDFFGVLRVVYAEVGGERYNLLFHGTTLHGVQSLQPSRRREPLSYYHYTGPIGQVFRAQNEEQRLRSVAVVGLGAGSLACYSHPGQDWTFYELDPLVAKTALDERFFTFLGECAPAANIVVGDGRLSLARATGQFDLIVLDAYSSDSIPIHLLSRESLALFLQRLTPHGLLAYHVSSRYLDVKQVLANLALDARLAGLAQTDLAVSEEQAAAGKIASEWVVLARTAEDFGALAEDTRWHRLDGQPGKGLWTDDFASIVSVLRLRRTMSGICSLPLVKRWCAANSGSR